MRTLSQQMTMILISTILLLIIHITTAQEDEFSPVPTPFNMGSDGVGEGPLIRTLSPTIDVNVLTGRGIPTRSPSFKPTYSPTETGFEVSIPVIDLPGVLPIGETAAPVFPKDTPSPTPDNENEDPVNVPAPTLSNGSNVQHNRRTGLLNNNFVFSLVIGSCYMILIEFC
jgi:hypothetical protein